MSDDLVLGAQLTIYSGNLLIIDPESIEGFDNGRELDLLMPFSQDLGERWKRKEEWVQENSRRFLERQKREEEHELNFQKIIAELHQGNEPATKGLQELCNETIYLSTIDLEREKKAAVDQQMKGYKFKSSPPHMLECEKYVFTRNWGENYFVVRTNQVIQIMHPSSETGRRLEAKDVKEEGTLEGLCLVSHAQMICDANEVQSLNNVPQKNYTVVRMPNGKYTCEFIRRGRVLKITPWEEHSVAQ